MSQLALTALLALAAAVWEAPTPLPPDVEETMALSAAPESLRTGAGVWRLEAKGYVRVRPSANGFNCLVERDERQGLSPVCYDAEGSDTLMKAVFVRAELVARRLPPDEVEARIAADYAAGRLIAPRRAGVAYMLSENFSYVDDKTHTRKCVFPPHVMVYAPGMRNADIGARPEDFGAMDRPWILNEGKPDAYIIMAAHGDHRCD